MTFLSSQPRSAGRALTLLSLTGLCAASVVPAHAGLSITTLASFTGSNGGQPQSGVTFDSSGNLFGTTIQGGTSGAGTVYEIAKGGNSLTTLTNFTGSGAGPNGGYPTAGVTFDSSGNLFGTTGNGGTTGYGTVYEIEKGSSSIITLASFTGVGAGGNGGYPIAGVTFDSSGNLFGTTVNGGTTGAGTVYEIAKGGSGLTTLANFTGVGAGPNGGSPHSGVTFDSFGNLFGTTANGGATGNGTVYEIEKGSSSIITLANFTGNGAGGNGGNPYAGVTFDSSGNLFGTTSGSASRVGTVYEIAKGSSSLTTLASFTGSGAGTNNADPSGVTFDSFGNLFGTTVNGGTTGNGTVFEIAKGGSGLTTLASFTGVGAGPNGGNPLAGVTFDSSGNLFGTTVNGGTTGNGTVYEIVGASSPSAAPEPSQFAGLGFAAVGLGGFLLRARKRRQNATPGE